MANEPSTISYDPEDRFNEAIASFEQARDDGRNPDPEQWPIRYPDVAERLRTYFADCARLEPSAELLRPPAPVSGTLPRSFGPYELLEEVGRGAMGVVYRARQAGLERPVALKLVLAGGHATPEDLARFRAEAQAVARLQHPYIVQIHEVGEHEGLPFLALEFCPGGNLARKLDGTPLPPAEGARLIEQLARAVHAVHEQNVVHRDLKPANVLLGPDRTPKVTDFGLAKRLDATSQTASGAIMGTPSYMAPEQARGQSKQVGPATDVWALGAILYEVLTGRPPFRAANVTDTLLQVMADDPVLPRLLQPKVPRDLETICLKCFQKDPSKRYASAEELAGRLGLFLEGQPIPDRPTGKVERFWRWCRRNPALAAAVTVAAALPSKATRGPATAVTWKP
jgi:eukaryotic-like serine/threonine-protein kinase